jgi:hypothetical protein
VSFDSVQRTRDTALVRRFGRPVRYIPVGEDARTVTGVFDNPTRVATAGPRSMAGRYPMLTLLRSEVPNLRIDDLFELDDVQYRCKFPQLDESEVVVAKLEMLK